MSLAGFARPAYDRGSMTGLTRYILRQCFWVMIFVTAALSAAVWLAQSLPLIDLIVNRGLSLDVFLYLAVLILAAIAYVILMSLSLYVLPVTSRAFKDLQFEIRNRFVSSLIQEGTFTTVSDKLTFYIRNRDADGDVVGLLVNDNRDPQRPVTILAQRAAFVDTPTGTRIIMLNGNRQQFDPHTRKLSVLTFQRYTLDLGSLQDAPVVRFRGAEERFLWELLFPPKLDPLVRRSFIMEANQRLLIPLSVLSFALIPLVCLLPGEFSRRGQAKRVTIAIGAAFVFQTASLGVTDLAARFDEAIPLMYVVNLFPFAVSLTILLQGGIRFGFRRLAYAAPHAD